MEQKRIFLVDDDKFLLTGLGRELESNNYLVTTAERGKDALKIVSEREFSGYIIDLVLDEIDGLAVTEAIKKKNPAAPILILTGYGDMESAVQAIRLGVNDYLEKPCESEELLRRLEETIEEGERKKQQLELQLERCLREKETIQREIHHRVKNNFSLISAMINLQMDNVINDHDKKILMDLEERIHAFSILHQSMYEENRFSTVNIQSYVQHLVNRIIATMIPASETIDVRFSVETHPLSMHQAFPLGLIVTETVMNAVTHGFGILNWKSLPDKPLSAGHPEGGEAKPVGTGHRRILEVSFKRVEEWYRLEITNNGRPFPHNVSIEEAQSMGLQLIRELSAQLDGAVEIRSDSKRTAVAIAFPAYPDR